MALSKRKSSLAASRTDGDDPVAVPNAGDVVSAILEAVRDGACRVDPGLAAELEAVSGFCTGAADGHFEEQGLAVIQAIHLPSAKDELDAVVAATETAANEIMNAAEQIESLVGKLDDAIVDQVSEHVMNIFQACGFQDIAGQRITRIDESLKGIEFATDSVLSMLGDPIAQGRVEEHRASRRDAASAQDEDSDLLHGPQLEGGGISQDEIDRLLASFD